MRHKGRAVRGGGARTWWCATRLTSAAVLCRRASPCSRGGSLRSAARAGQAGGIGHDREQTLIALQRVLPRLETRGFRFVPVSQLLP